MIPQSVAYAALAGMPVVTGLYATLAAGMLVAVLLGNSTRCRWGLRR
jgi:SulP family sulfate permease